LLDRSLASCQTSAALSNNSRTDQTLSVSPLAIVGACMPSDWRWLASVWDLNYFEMMLTDGCGLKFLMFRRLGEPITARQNAPGISEHSGNEKQHLNRLPHHSCLGSPLQHFSDRPRLAGNPSSHRGRVAFDGLMPTTEIVPRKEDSLHGYEMLEALGREPASAGQSGG
jgi:hypothetical protein